MKTIFFAWNYKINNGWEINSFSGWIAVIGWSLYYDLVAIAFAAAPFFLVSLLPMGKRLLNIVAAFSSLLMVALFLLNTIDIFYFSFHRQRADADLLYVLRNPHNYGSYYAVGLLSLLIVCCIIFGRYAFRNFRKLADEKLSGISFYSCVVILMIVIASLLTGRSKKILPSRPLTDVSAIQLPLTQNSFHTFLYSIYRSRESVIPFKMYMVPLQQQQLFSINKMNSNTAAKKNIVLFIMESVPYEFFDSSSKFKPVLPFLDSLKNHATYYSNAFSYSYTSNKGITAILTGIPTLTDIPLYHSGFTSINKTGIGKLLQERGYQSSFFIGDNYDDFGFAKCCNWTGIQQYYCMENVPGYKKMEKHTMGLQDEYTLNFMQQKLQSTPQPFFSTFYNISTHYPNDLTASYKTKLAEIKATSAMKSMMYYDDCLAQFFSKAAKENWFNNTVFIFCSDHWASPDADNSNMDKVNSFRIPIMIFDPSQNRKQVKSNLTSQLDIMNTLLAYAGIKDPFKSYGQSLLDLTADNRPVFTKIDNSIYQAINNDYVLGFNADDGKRLYCYNYKTDKESKQNIIPGINASADSLELYMKAFLQTAALHYKGK